MVREGGYACKRGSAASLAKDLRDADKKKSPEMRRAEVKKSIDVIVHPRLREALEKANVGETPGESTAQVLKDWLVRSIRGSLKESEFSSHPADQARLRMLQGVHRRQIGRDTCVYWRQESVPVAESKHRPGEGYPADLTNPFTGMSPIPPTWPSSSVTAKKMGRSTGRNL